MRFSIILVLIAFASVSLAVSDDDITTWLPGLGSVRGTLSPNGKVRVFRGIPYATAGRWEIPSTPKPWGEFNATKDGAGCPQRCTQPPHTCADTFAESCLFINVYTPSREQIEDIRSKTGRYWLPIVVFFHGGNYHEGSGNGELYNAEYLAEKHGVVYVGVNYRLGLLGFLGSSKMGLQGNYALYDSAAALAFVHVFGPAFGGDVSRVTVWGQSAGSMTIPMLMTYAFDNYYYDTLLPAYESLKPCSLVDYPSEEEEERLYLEHQACLASGKSEARCVKEKTTGKVSTWTPPRKRRPTDDGEGAERVRDGPSRMCDPAQGDIRRMRRGEFVLGEIASGRNIPAYSSVNLKDGSISMQFPFSSYVSPSTFKLGQALNKNRGLTTNNVYTATHEAIEALTATTTNALRVCESARRNYLSRRVNRCGDNNFFHGAHLTSNPFTLPLRTVTEMDGISDFVAKNTTCDRAPTPAETLACLRKLPSDQIMVLQDRVQHNMDLHKRSMTQFMMISPIIESEMLPLHPYQFMSRGAIVDIPIMMGTTYDEGNLFIFEGFQKELDEVGYWALLGVVFGFDKVDTVQKMYPPDKSTKDQRLVMSQLTSDVVFHCVNRNISSMIARREGDTPEQKAWVYVFDHVASFMKPTWPDQPECWTATCHGADLPFWYHVGWPKYFMPTQAEIDLSETMVYYQANFFWNQDPGQFNGTYVKPGSERKLGPWPKFDDVSKTILRFTEKGANTEKMFRSKYCDYIDEFIGYSFADPKNKK